MYLIRAGTWIQLKVQLRRESNCKNLYSMVYCLQETSDILTLWFREYFSYLQVPSQNLAVNSCSRLRLLQWWIRKQPPSEKCLKSLTTRPQEELERLNVGSESVTCTNEHEQKLYRSIHLTSYSGENQEGGERSVSQNLGQRRDIRQLCWASEDRMC